jgi:hypothetical protein
VRGYDSLAGSVDRLAARFDAAMRTAPDPLAFGRDYGSAATPAMKAMSLLSANVRLILIALTCLVGAPALFWWAEIILLTAIAVATIGWHRRIERRLADRIDDHDRWPVRA